jgi:hypothetical protein
MATVVTIVLLNIDLAPQLDVRNTRPILKTAVSGRRGYDLEKNLDSARDGLPPKKYARQGGRRASEGCEFMEGEWGTPRPGNGESRAMGFAAREKISRR